MKRATLGIIIALVAAAAIGVGTWAYFNDIETSDENVFTGGVLDLEVDAQNDPNVATYFEVGCIAPGDWGSEEIMLSNVGCVDGIADIEIINAVCHENGLTEPESDLGDTGPEGELDEHLWLTMSAYDGGALIWKMEDWLCNLADLDFDIGALDAYSTLELAVGWELPADTGNIVQTDSCCFDIEFSLNQAVEHPPTPLIVVPDDGGWVSGTSSIDVIEDYFADDIISTLFEHSTNGVDWVVIGEDLDGSDIRDDDPEETEGDGWSIEWDTTMVAEGFWYLRATMTDTDGDTGSDEIMVYVDPTPPVPEFVSPQHEDTLSGIVPLALATDDEDVDSAIWAYFEVETESPYKKDLKKSGSTQWGPRCSPRSTCFSLQWLDKKYDDELVPKKKERPCALTSLLISKYKFCKGKGTKGTSLAEAVAGLGNYTADHGGNFTVTPVDTKPKQGWFTFYKQQLPEEDIIVSVRIKNKGAKDTYHAVTGWMFDQEKKIKKKGKVYYNVGFQDPASGGFRGHSRGSGIYMSEDGRLIHKGQFWRWWVEVRSYIVVSPEHTHDQLGGAVTNGEVKKKKPITVDDNRQDGFTGQWDTTTVEDGTYILLASMKDEMGNEHQETILVFVDQTPNPPQPPPEPGVEWSRVFGGEDQDHAYSVEPTADGGFIVAGATYSFGAGGHDILLIKTDPLGTIEWWNTFGGGESDFGYSVKQTSDGGYIVAGETYSAGLGEGDACLIKTDHLGFEQWSRVFGGDEYDAAYAVVEAADGGFAVAGVTASFGPMDAWLIKTDPLGMEEWSHTYGGDPYDAAYDLDEAMDGGFVLAGATGSLGEDVDDAYLIKTDPMGMEEWSSTFGGEEHDAAYSVEAALDGGYVLAGETFSYGAGEGDVYLIKTDAGGNEQWSETFGGPEYDYANCVGNTEDDGYIVAGGTHSYGADEEDVYLIKTDAGGNEQWSETFGGEGHDRGYSAAQSFDGGFIVSGCTDSYGAGHYDAYLIKLVP